jgi:hypothetical protein
LKTFKSTRAIRISARPAFISIHVHITTVFGWVGKRQCHIFPSHQVSDVILEMHNFAGRLVEAISVVGIGGTDGFIQITRRAVRRVVTLQTCSVVVAGTSGVPLDVGLEFSCLGETNRRDANVEDSAICGR